jgi:hypothetical protein
VVVGEALFVHLFGDEEKAILGDTDWSGDRSVFKHSVQRLEQLALNETVS